jgi:hypothetical protein
MHLGVEFLERLGPGGPWVLSAVVPDGKITTITAHKVDQAEAFIREHNGKRNIYYSVNPARGRSIRKPRRRTLPSSMHSLISIPMQEEMADAAKERYLARLNASFELKPTAAIDSGNGIQGVWRLDPLTNRHFKWSGPTLCPAQLRQPLAKGPKAAR